MKHVVLIGDSILDNRAYTRLAPDVRLTLSNQLPSDWKVTLLARDGSRTPEVLTQVTRVPDGATHAIVSSGGNDIIALIGVLGESGSVGATLDRLAQIRQRFRQDYDALLSAVAERVPTVAVCTIYDPIFDDLKLRGRIGAMLALFNDIILHSAAVRGWAVLDLRLVCCEPSDFAKNIEPSADGGAKIAAAIIRYLCSGDPRQCASTIWK